MSEATRFHNRVTVTVDATPSWWKHGSNGKHAAVAGYFAGGSGQCRFRWATDVTTGLGGVEVRALLPIGVDFGADLDAMRADLEAMKPELVGPGDEPGPPQVVSFTLVVNGRAQRGVTSVERTLHPGGQGNIVVRGTGEASPIEELCVRRERVDVVLSMDGAIVAGKCKVESVEWNGDTYKYALSGALEAV